MSEVLIQWLNLATVIVIVTVAMMMLFTFAAIIVTRLGDDNYGSKAIIIVFSGLNALYNVSFGSLLCLDFPERFGEPTTKRLQRYKKIYSKDSRGIHKWRWNIAMGVCWWLNVWDENHC